MKLTALSDLHGDLILNIHPCDVVVVCGDIVPLDIQRNIPKTIEWFKSSFLKWVDKLPCKKVILVAGNHDFWMDEDYWKDYVYHVFSRSCAIQTIEQVVEGHEKLIYLKGSGCEIDGVKFWGMPWITGLRNWAFNVDDDKPYTDLIPDDTDVLVSHAPAYGEVGTVLQMSWNHGHNYGSKNLRDKLESSNIRYALAGHIHSGSHSGEKIGNTICYNVSIKNENYQEAYYPLQLDV